MQHGARSVMVCDFRLATTSSTDSPMDSAPKLGDADQGYSLTWQAQDIRPYATNMSVCTVYRGYIDPPFQGGGF
jgi:hypothetical protein